MKRLMFWIATAWLASSKFRHALTFTFVVKLLILPAID